MSRRSRLIPETLHGRVVLPLSLMVIQAIVGASPALALT
jgi:hypothetical protein